MKTKRGQAAPRLVRGGNPRFLKELAFRFQPVAVMIAFE
jgi:hypothetical protein